MRGWEEVGTAAWQPADGLFAWRKGRGVALVLFSAVAALLHCANHSSPHAPLASHPTQPISARPVTTALDVRVDDYLFLQLRPEECSFEVLAANVRVIRRWEGMGSV